MHQETTLQLFSQNVKQLEADSSSNNKYFVTPNLCYKRYFNEGPKYFAINIFYQCYWYVRFIVKQMQSMELFDVCCGIL